jgi:putative flavoprotein involved in K+ transport
MTATRTRQITNPTTTANGTRATTNQRVPERFDVVVIGAGQAGLSAGYHLTRRGLNVVILEANERVGDNWRNRWDSLRVFSPARYDGLPGMRFPAPPSSFPTGQQVGDFLEAYAATMQLPVRTGVSVAGLRRMGDREDGYLIDAGGRQIEAASVIVATGPERAAVVPDFAGQLDPTIRQLHSSEYRNPSQLLDGPVLVVGAGNSGADISLELAANHRVTLCGRDPGTIPFRIETRRARIIIRGLWFIANHVLSVKTPIGRKVQPHIQHGTGPVVRVKPSDLEAAGVERVLARAAGVRDGQPLLDDGRVVEAANVVWCTGFRLDFEWIHLPIIGDDGWPAQDRGVASAAPGLYFLGLPFQSSFGSMLIGGVGRDASYIADKVASHAKTLQRQQSNVAA